jgi:hypothetical protein
MDWETLERRYHADIRYMKTAQKQGDFELYYFVRLDFNRTCMEIIEGLMEENVDILKRLKGETNG